MRYVSERIKSFWSGTLEDGPLVSVWLPEPVANLVQWDLQAQVDYWERRRALHDDTVPHIAISNEAETVAALFGVPVEYSANSVWARPILSQLSTGLRVGVDPDSLLYKELVRRIDLASVQQEHSLKMIPVAGISDLMSSMRGAQDLMIDLMEDPETSAAFATHLGLCWRKVISELLARIPLFDGGLVGGLSWLPGRGLTISADMMMMCSPEWFRDFIWPEERRMLEKMDSVIYHLHSGGSGPALAEWIAPHPRVLGVEISHDPSGPSLEHMESTFMEIQRHTNLLVTCWSRKFTDDELAWLARHLDKRRLYLFQYASEIGEGLAFLERVRARFR